jgi:hypothetical protein
MMIRAHFDGQVFVPEGPVDLPRNTEVQLICVEPGDESRPLASLSTLAETFPDEPGWPADGAAETDHYMYGSPKRS